jgi:hypothetical protein
MLYRQQPLSVVFEIHEFPPVFVSDSVSALATSSLTHERVVVLDRFPAPVTKAVAIGGD